MTWGKCWSFLGGAGGGLIRNLGDTGRGQAPGPGCSALPQPSRAHRFIFLALGFSPLPPHSPQPGSTKLTALGLLSCSALLFSRWKSATTSSPANASLITPLWSMPPSCGETSQCPAAPGSPRRTGPVPLTSSSMTTGRLGH